MADIADHVHMLAQDHRDKAPVIVLVGSQVEASRLDRGYCNTFAEDPAYLRRPGDMADWGEMSFVSYGALLELMVRDGAEVVAQQLADRRAILIVDQVVDLSVDSDLVLASLMRGMEEEQAPLLLLVLCRNKRDINLFRYHIDEPQFAVDLSPNRPEHNIQERYNGNSTTVSAFVNQTRHAGENVLYFGDKPPSGVDRDSIIKITATSAWPAELTADAGGYVITVAPSAWSRAFTIPNISLVVSGSAEYRVESNLGEEVLQIGRTQKLTRAHHQLQLQFAQQAGTFLACYPQETASTFAESPLAVEETRDEHSGDIMRLAMGLSYLFAGRESYHVPVYGMTKHPTLVLLGIA